MTKRTTVVLLSSVCDIDFERLKKQGIETILFDIEGTITPWGTTHVSDSIKTCVKNFGFKKIGIVTNLHKKHADRAQAVALQIDAGAYRYPKVFKDRKPSARMIHSNIDALNTHVEKTVMVGDKIFDVLAAKKAGLPYVFWVQKLGGPDHWFDRIVYRRFELFLKKIVT